MGRTRAWTPERAEANRRWRQDNVERLKDYEQKRKSDPKRRAAHKHYQRKHRYGISPEEYAALVERAGGRCELCGRKFRSGKRPIHIDHDHETGKIRGLLYPGCNTALGILGDRPGIERALAYLLGAEQTALGLAWCASSLVQLRERPDRAVPFVRHHASGCECLPCRFAGLRDVGRVEGDREQLRARHEADLLRDDSLGDVPDLVGEERRHRLG